MPKYLFLSQGNEGRAFTCSGVLSQGGINTFTSVMDMFKRRVTQKADMLKQEIAERETKRLKHEQRFSHPSKQEVVQ